MSSLDERTAVKQTPEEKVAALGAYIEYLEKSSSNKEKETAIRERVFNTIYRDGMLPKNAIDDVETVVQYILNGKQDAPIDVVSDSPLIPLGDVVDFIQEKLKESPLPLGLSSLTPKIAAKRAILIELANRFGIPEANNVSGWSPQG